MEPQVSGFHYGLGFSYWRRAQLDRAMASFDRAIELDPNNVKARWARVMLWAPAFSSKGTDDSPDRSGFGGELAKIRRLVGQERQPTARSSSVTYNLFS